MECIRDQIGDGLPLKGSGGNTGTTNGPVEIESELVELPMPDGDGPVSELSRMLPDEPGPLSEPEANTGMSTLEDPEETPPDHRAHAKLVG